MGNLRLCNPCGMGDRRWGTLIEPPSPTGDAGDTSTPYGVRVPVELVFPQFLLPSQTFSQPLPRARSSRHVSIIDLLRRPERLIEHAPQGRNGRSPPSTARSPIAAPHRQAYMAISAHTYASAIRGTPDTISMVGLYMCTSVSAGISCRIQILTATNR